MSKAKFAAAKELIDSKQYSEARAILKTIDHPAARQWEDKLDRMAPAKAGGSPAAAEPVAAKIGMKRFWRTLWGILTLASLGWMCYGLMVSSAAYSEVITPAASEAEKGGAAIGASLGVTGFVCIGLPFFLLFVVLYWRNGVAIQKAKDHAEMLTAMKGR